MSRLTSSGLGRSLPSSTFATTFSRSSLWTLRPCWAQPPLSLPQVDSSNDLHPPLPSSVDPRPPLLPSAVLDLRLLRHWRWWPLWWGQRGGGGGGGGGRRHHNCNGGGGGCSGGTDSGSITGGTTIMTTVQRRGGTPWSSFYNPRTGTINMWLGPSTPSVPSRPLHTFFAAPPVGPPFTPPLATLSLPPAPPP
jgi:hypothetical protein